MYVAEWSLTAGLISITPESSIFSESGTIIRSRRVADVVVTLVGTSIVLTRLLIVNISLT